MRFNFIGSAAIQSMNDPMNTVARPNAVIDLLQLFPSVTSNSGPRYADGTLRGNDTALGEPCTEDENGEPWCERGHYTDAQVAYSWNRVRTALMTREGDPAIGSAQAFLAFSAFEFMIYPSGKEQSEAFLSMANDILLRYKPNVTSSPASPASSGGVLQSSHVNLIVTTVVLSACLLLAIIIIAALVIRRRSKPLAEPAFTSIDKGSMKAVSASTEPPA